MFPLPSLALSLLPLACGPAADTGATESDDSGHHPAEEVVGDDTDGDTILDIHEGDGLGGAVDSDGDGTPDHLDTDSDDDGIPDVYEAGDDVPGTLPVDSDLDSTADFRDLDSDDNCLGDAVEVRMVAYVPTDTDLDGDPDFRDFDDDADGILDTIEIGDDCADRDSDVDGVPDRLDPDSDGDGIGDVWEAGTNPFRTEPVDTDGDGVPDYLDGDSDGDSISDRDEGGVDDPGAEPRDTDGDGAYDFADLDADGDGLGDRDELHLHLTDPYDADTDGDGYTDGIEHIAGTDPLGPESFPEGIYVELGERRWVEEEFEFDVRIQKADVAFLLDSTCSMAFTLDSLARDFSGIVTDLSFLFSDVEYGFATFDDFAYRGFGEIGVDKPFILRQQITSSTSRVQSQMSGVPLHNGVDGVASTLEAVYQAASGVGYDQNCDTLYQNDLDVLPFLADEGDPFGGVAGQSFDADSPGGGEIGGMGYRELALPIIVYGSDTWMRDGDAGYRTPRGCPGEATMDDVTTAANAIGARLLGVCVGGTTCRDQMESLAETTGSTADLDGDGRDDELLVVDWRSGDDDFRDTVTVAIEDLVNSIEFETVELVFEGDEWGFVGAVEPAVYENVDDLADGDTVLTFTVGFLGVVPSTTEDQVFTMTMNVIGDESVLLDTQDVTILVPGSSY